MITNVPLPISLPTATQSDVPADKRPTSGAPAVAHPADIDAMTAALAGTAERLHGIVSRTELAHIAAEVLRLNDAVRVAVEPYLPCSDPPGAYLQVLVTMADSTNATQP